MNKVEQALCRIREKLPDSNDFVTLGVGCVVKHEQLTASLGWKCPNLIVTSVHVLTPQHLASDRVFFAEFFVFEKKGYEVFELKSAAELCRVLSSHTFGEEEDTQQPNEQLTVISVEPLDKRGFLKRMVKKSSLQNTRPIDCFDFENFESELAEGIFCNVIREFGSFAQEFETRTYKFKYSAEKKLYSLEDFGHRYVDLEVRSFPDDQILAGGVVFSKQGLYLGCLGYSMGQVLPTFIPDAYLEHQGVETMEEAPEREEQADNEVVAMASDDNVKTLSTDENENRDLVEKGFDTDNNMEEQSCSDNTFSTEPQTETSSNQDEQEEMSDTSPREHLESQETEETDDRENFKQESENAEKISEDKTLENIENNPRILEMKDIHVRRDSSDLEFVVSVENDDNETSEKYDTLPEEANSNQIEDNAINNEENVVDKDIHEEIPSETEVIEEKTQFENDEKPQCEPNEETQDKNVDSHENESESVTDIIQEDTSEDHKDDNTTNADQNDLISDNVIDESDVVANNMDTQLDSDIRESSKETIPMERSSFPAEITPQEDKVVKSMPNITEGSDNTLDAELSSVEIISGKDKDTMIEINEKDTDQATFNTSMQECKSDEDTSSVDQVEVVTAVEREETEDDAELSSVEIISAKDKDTMTETDEKHTEQDNTSTQECKSDQDLSSVDRVKVVTATEREEAEADVELSSVEIMSEKDKDTMTEIDVKDTEQDNTSQECKFDEDPSSVDQVEVNAVERVDELMQTEAPETQHDEPTDKTQEHKTEERQKEGIEVEVVAGVESENELMQTEASEAQQDEPKTVETQEHKNEETHEEGIEVELVAGVESENELIQTEASEAQQDEPKTEETQEHKNEETHEEGIEVVVVAGVESKNELIQTEASEAQQDETKTEETQEHKNEETHEEGIEVVVVVGVERENELILVTEASEAQQDELKTEETQEHKYEETHEEGIEGAHDVINNEDTCTSEQENNTEAAVESQVPEESADSDDQQENELMNVETVPENLSIKPDSPDGVAMEVKTDVMELEKPVKQEPGDALEPDDLLSTKVTDNPKALEDLSLLLDTEYQHGGVSSWHDLAELLAIPKEAYDHCLSFSKPSPTEDLMVFLANTKPQFTISDLKDSLRSVSRGDTVHLIDRYIARSIISDETVIPGIIERDDIHLLGELALKLDRGQQNWKILARQLGVPSRIFRNFGSHQRQNNALLMLKYLPIFDPDLTVDSLKESCKTIGLLEVVKFLDASGVPGEDAIMDILEDTDVIDELTDMLNEEDQDGPNWKRLGRKLNIPEEKFSIFEPSKKNSATTLLLQSIAQCEPDITVDELILALVAMKRHDIIEMLGKHFRNSDIRSILEENNCLPPQPETPREVNKDQDESIA